jgi:hypothetical protein
MKSANCSSATGRSHCRADGGAGDHVLGDRRVEDALAELLAQAGEHAEDAAVHSHVFAVEDDRGIAAHLLDERLADGVTVGEGMAHVAYTLSSAEAAGTAG